MILRAIKKEPNNASNIPTIKKGNNSNIKTLRFFNQSLIESCSTTTKYCCLLLNILKGNATQSSEPIICLSSIAPWATKLAVTCCNSCCTIALLFCVDNSIWLWLSPTTKKLTSREIRVFTLSRKVRFNFLPINNQPMVAGALIGSADIIKGSLPTMAIHALFCCLLFKSCAKNRSTVRSSPPYWAINIKLLSNTKAISALIRLPWLNNTLLIDSASSP